jgi:hypothetical protein
MQREECGRALTPCIMSRSAIVFTRTDHIGRLPNSGHIESPSLHNPRQKTTFRIFHIVQTTIMFNGTLPALAHIAYAPVRLLASIPRPHFSYVPAPHVKLKADSITMVFFCIARQMWVYVEGWCNSRRRAREETVDNEKRDRKRRRKTKAKRAIGTRTRGRMVLKGRYTLILQ